MSAKAIREATGKDIINRNLAGGTAAAKCRFASVTEDTDFEQLAQQNPWLKTEVTIE
jgi:ATP citrate (pro-S)-lyase